MPDKKRQNDASGRLQQTNSNHQWRIRLRLNFRPNKGPRNKRGSFLLPPFFMFDSKITAAVLVIQCKGKMSKGESVFPYSVQSNHFFPPCIIKTNWKVLMNHDSSDGRAIDYKLGGPEFKSPLWIQ